MAISEEIYPELKLSYEGNYLVWKQKMLYVLEYNGERQALSMPVSDYDSRLDNQVRRRILRRLDDKLRAEFDFHLTASAVMKKLDAIFNPTDLKKRSFLYHNYLRYQMERGTHIDKHIFTMRAMVKGLEAAGEEISDAMEASVLLNSVPMDWRQDIDINLLESGFKKDSRLNTAIRALRRASVARKWKGIDSEEGPDYVDSGDSYILDSSGANISIWLKKIDMLLLQTYLDNDDESRLSRARHLVLDRLHDDLFIIFHENETSTSVLDAIKQHFCFVSMANAQHILERYIYKALDDGTSIKNHMKAMCQFARDLETEADICFSTEQQAIVYLHSLPTELDEIVDEVLDNEVLDDLELITVMLEQGDTEMLEN